MCKYYNNIIAASYFWMHSIKCNLKEEQKMKLQRTKIFKEFPQCCLEALWQSDARPFCTDTWTPSETLCDHFHFHINPLTNVILNTSVYHIRAPDDKKTQATSWSKHERWQNKEQTLPTTVILNLRADGTEVRTISTASCKEGGQGPLLSLITKTMLSPLRVWQK